MTAAQLWKRAYWVRQVMREIVRDYVDPVDLFRGRKTKATRALL